MSKITSEQVKHVAHVARLAITEEEANKLAEELHGILAFTEQLNELDTENVEPTLYGIDVKNVMREDVPGKGLTQEEVLKNAPDHLYGQIKVPTIIE